MNKLNTQKFQKLKEGIDFNFILFQLQFEKGSIVVWSHCSRQFGCKLKLDKTLINTAKYTDCTICFRFAIQET